MQRRGGAGGVPRPHPGHLLLLPGCVWGQGTAEEGSLASGLPHALVAGAEGQGKGQWGRATSAFGARSKRQ